MPIGRSAWLLAAMAAATAASAQKPPVSGAWHPNPAEIAGMEAALAPALPAPTALADYDRSYAGRIEGGRRLIVAELVRRPAGTGLPRPGARRVDAGCAVLEARYDPATERLLGFGCSPGLPPERVRTETIARPPGEPR